MAALAQLPEPGARRRHRRGARIRVLCPAPAASGGRRLIPAAWLLLAALARQAGAQTPLRPAACPAAGEPGAGWTDFAHPGLKLTLRLPAELRPVREGSLRGVEGRARRKEMPSTAPETVRLVLAWEAPAKGTGPVRQLLFYAASGARPPEGRPCALAISGHPGLVFRTAFTSPQHATDEYWMEAYWPGWVVLAVGPSAEVYEAGLGLLRTIAITP